MATRDGSRPPSPWYCVHGSEKAAFSTMVAAGLTTAAALIACGGLAVAGEWLLAAVALVIAVVAGWNTWASGRTLSRLDRIRRRRTAAAPAPGTTMPAATRAASPRPGGTTMPATRAPARPAVPPAPRPTNTPGPRPTPTPAGPVRPARQAPAVPLAVRAPAPPPAAPSTEPRTGRTRGRTPSPRAVRRVAGPRSD